MGRKLIAALGLASLLASGACATYGYGGYGGRYGSRYYVQVGPPAARYEQRYGAPGRGYVWQQGYYRWDGRGYYWVPGRYELAPRGYSRWEPARWQHDRGGWFFIEGRWR